jgi:6-phosphogluconolactonase
MNLMTNLLALAFLMSLSHPSPTAAAEASSQTSPHGTQTGDLTVFVGGYTTPDNPGIRVGRFSPITGTVHSLQLAAVIRKPSFLALHPNRMFLYAVTETSSQNGRRGGGVSAFAIDHASGELRLLNNESTRGDGPCHVAVDPSGHSLLVANYGGGSTTSFALKFDGRLSPAVSFHQHRGSSVHPNRQQGPHAHGVYTDPTSRFALVPDLGLDQILLYRLDTTTGQLTPHEPSFASLPGGAGPRHLTFDPAHNYVYVINELDSTVSVMRWHAQEGTLEPLQQISTLPDDFEGDNTTAEIEVHPNGRFLYASNRGHDSIAVFAIDLGDGRLSSAGHHPTGGRTPRHFTLDPTGGWLLAANQDSDSIVALRVDLTTGKLSDPRPPVATPKPSCILFLPTALPTPAE